MGGICPHVHWEQELLRRAKRREREAEERLLDRYRPLVEAKVRTFGFTGSDRDDLVQEGMVSLLGAIQRYDERRSAGFAAFAEVCVRRRLITVTQTERRSRAVPLCAYVESVPTTMPAPELALAELHLTELERRVALAFGEGFTYQEISRNLNCGIKRVDNAMQRIRRKCQALIEA